MEYASLLADWSSARRPHRMDGVSINVASLEGGESGTIDSLFEYRINADGFGKMALREIDGANFTPSRKIRFTLR